MFCVVCSVFSVVCAVCCVLCIVCCVLCAEYSVLCTVCWDVVCCVHGILPGVMSSV